MASDLAKRNNVILNAWGGWLLCGWIAAEKQAGLPESLPNWRCKVSQKVLMSWGLKVGGGWGVVWKSVQGALNPCIPDPHAAQPTSCPSDIQTSKGRFIIWRKGTKEVLKVGTPGPEKMRSSVPFIYLVPECHWWPYALPSHLRQKIIWKTTSKTKTYMDDNLQGGRPASLPSPPTASNQIVHMNGPLRIITYLKEFPT